MINEPTEFGWPAFVSLVDEQLSLVLTVDLQKVTLLSVVYRWPSTRAKLGQQAHGVVDTCNYWSNYFLLLLSICEE